MAEEDVLELLRLMLMQMESQQQALVKLTEVLDHYLKDPVKVDVVANAPKITLTENNSVGINPQNNHVLVDNFPENRDAPRIEPFQRVIVAGSLGQDGETAVGVPDGKRLVIEFVSILSYVNAAVFLRTIANGVSVKYAMPFSGRIYADPGASAFVRVERTGGGMSAISATVAISGQLVKV